MNRAQRITQKSLEGNRIYELLQLDVSTKHPLFTMKTDAVGYMYCC